MSAEAEPDRGKPITNRHGRKVTGATADDYPLTGTCETCGEEIAVVDATADWAHLGTGRGPCNPLGPGDGRRWQRYIDRLAERSKLDCGHVPFEAGHCAEMGCPNYVNKCPTHRVGARTEAQEGHE